MTSLCIFLALSEKHVKARGVASRSVSLSRHDYRVHDRFGRYSKSETAKCRPVEDLSALNQTSGQERKQGASKLLCSAKPAPDHGSKAYHSIIESPGTVKTRVFHFWTSCYIDTSPREESAIATVHKQRYPFFLVLLNDGFSELRAPSIINRCEI